jgi:hypothetical protein
MVKSYEIECSSETQLDLHCMPAQVLLEDDYFATVPMIVVRPAVVRQSAIEEELHTSFEEAISGRVAAVNRQLSNLSSPELRACLPARADGVGKSKTRIPLLSAILARRQVITLLCLGLNLLLLGFDGMGVLVLVR